MSENGREPRFANFGPYRFDRIDRALFRDGKPVATTPKSLELLAFFLRNPGRVLSRETLTQAVWGDVFIDDNNLHQQVATLRKLLETDRGRLIETVPRRGYRFVGTIRSEKKSVSRGAFVAIVTVAAVLGFTLLAVGRTRWAAPRGLHVIAVLPFREIPPNADSRYMALGFTDALISRLGMATSLIVRPISALNRLPENLDARSAGETLHADSVITGTVQRSGSAIRVTAQMIDVADGSERWSAQFDGDPERLFELEDALSAEVARRLIPEATEDQLRRLPRARSADAMANDAFLRGEYLLHYRIDVPGAVSLFQRAVARDPKFALAWAGLAEARAHPATRATAQEVDAAAAAAVHAIAIDSNLAEAHGTLGFIRLFQQCDWNGAEHELRIALQLQPSNARTLDWCAFSFAIRGRTAEATQMIRRAAAIDPTSDDIAVDVGVILYFNRQFDQAAAAFRDVLRKNPDATSVRPQLIAALRQAGRFDEALREETQVRHTALDPISNVAIIRTLQGDNDSRQRLLRDLQRPEILAQMPPDSVAKMYAMIGETDSAIYWLERTVHDRAFGIMFLRVSPEFDSLRGDPRFEKLVRSVGL